MIDRDNVPPVAHDELLARFATQSAQFRASDLTVKQDLFMPHPRSELSVMRHRDASLDEVWLIGQGTASQLNRFLYGRADIEAAACEFDELRVVASRSSQKTPTMRMSEVGRPAKRIRRFLHRSWQPQQAN